MNPSHDKNYCLLCCNQQQKPGNPEIPVNIFTGAAQVDFFWEMLVAGQVNYYPVRLSLSIIYVSNSPCCVTGGEVPALKNQEVCLLSPHI
jgi:hypothetical protein